jgi:putative MATE family efflux protein
MRFSDLEDEPFRFGGFDHVLLGRIGKIGSFVMLAMLTQFIVGAADALMVGSMDDVAVATAGQAALGLGTPLYWMVGGFFSAVSYGTQAITARRYGAHDEAGAGRVLSNSVMVGLIAAIVGGFVAFVTAEPMSAFFAESSEAQARLASSYAKIRAFGLGGTVLIFSFKAFFDGLGRTHLHLIASMAMTLFNIVLNFPLIYGWSRVGLEPMGVEGAAIASAISSWVGLSVMVGASVRREIRERFQPFAFRHLDLGIMARIVRLMLPSGSASVFLMVGFLLFVKGVSRVDAQAGVGDNLNAAATTILMYILGMVALPLMAFGSATATAVSQALGAKKRNLAARAGWEAVRGAVVATSVLSALIWLFTDPIIYVWNPANEAIQAALVDPLRLVALMLPLVAVGLVLSQALYGAGANVYVMICEGLLHAGVLVPMSWLLGPVLGYGLLGCWAGGSVYVLGLALSMAFRFAGKSWRNIEL